MSLFRKMFGAGLSDIQHDNLRENIQGLYQQLADSLAQKAVNWPSPEFIAEIQRQSGCVNMPEDRIRFGLSIANEVINIWCINQSQFLPETAMQIVDLLHRAFFRNQGGKDVRIGDFIVSTAELSRIAHELEDETRSPVSNVRAVDTNWWTLMDLVYLPRQQVYIDALEAATGSKLPDGFSPTTRLAFELATHLTGADAESGGDSYNWLMQGLDASLLLYERGIRSMLSGQRLDEPGLRT